MERNEAKDLEGKDLNAGLSVIAERLSEIAETLSAKAGITEAEGKDNERLAVIAALVATISFAAAFTIPGGVDEKGKLVLMHEAVLKAFILSDSLAFSLSILSLSQLIYSPSSGVYKFIYKISKRIMGGIVGRDKFVNEFGTLEEFEQQLSWPGIPALQWSVRATMVAFATGIYVVVAPKCQRVAVAVCIITITGPFLESIIVSVTIFLKTAKMVVPAGKLNKLRMRITL